MIRGLVAATAVTALLSACGGGGESETDASDEVLTPKKIELADACVKVNKAAENILQTAAGIADSEAMRVFADSLQFVVDQVDDRGRDIVADLQARTRETSEILADEQEPADRLQAGMDWLNTYKRMQDACVAVGSPISIPEG